MKSQHRLLIYNRDPAIRKATASYLNRNGLLTDSCGSLAELKRLLAWHHYEFILVNIDQAHPGPESSSSATSLTALIGEHQAECIIIATSNRLREAAELKEYRWFLQEPLTPKGILTVVSKIRQQQPKTNSQRHLKLRKSLSKAMPGK